MGLFLPGLPRLTNGVSFELVAGAICAIKFSQTVTGSGTLNINSTGVKSYSHTWSKQGNPGGGTSISKSYVSYMIVVYDGSTYLFPTAFELSGSYGDAD